MPGCGYCCEEASKKFSEEDILRLSNYLEKHDKIFSSYCDTILPKMNKFEDEFGVKSEVLPLELLLKYHDSKEAYPERAKELMVLDTKNHLWGELEFDHTNIYNCLFYSNACSIHPGVIGKEIRPDCCNSVCVEGYKPNNVIKELHLS